MSRAISGLRRAGRLQPRTVSDGLDGWSPVFAGEQDGTRTLLRIVDWVGGQGDKPALGYIGDAGAKAPVEKDRAFNFNPLSAETQRVQVSTTGIKAITFARPFPAGMVPMILLTVEAPSASNVRYTAQINGQATNTGCSIRAFRDNLSSLGASLTALLGAVLFQPAPSVWVNVAIVPPPVPTT